ncbi:MAG: hypothetical protein IRZ14_20150 [Chloroflexi bacterium]|nr:hypothetical protein [Chloroflexota bacterium]
MSLSSELSPEARAFFAAAARRRRRRSATCAQCGRAFEAWGVQRYCSPTCRWRAYYYRRLAPGRRSADA